MQLLSKVKLSVKLVLSFENIDTQYKIIYVSNSILLFCSLPSNSFHVMCTSCTNKCRGHLFICISCGCINNRSAKMIKQNGCKCSNAPQPVFAPANVQTTGDNLIMHEPKDHGDKKSYVRVLYGLMI